MNRVHNYKKVTRIALIFIAIAIFVSSFTLLTYGRAFAEDTDTDTFRDFKAVEIGIENSKFTNSSGNFPQTPTSWSETSISGNSKGDTISGVISPVDYNTTDNRDATKLNNYPEYKSDVPRLPNEITGIAGNENEKFLMINNQNKKAFGYNSSNVDLGANKFYKFSVWVKTGDFLEGGGAAVRLNGLGIDAGFNKICTVANIARDASGIAQLNRDNKFGWVQYSFLIATSPLKSHSVSLALTVGDHFNGEQTMQQYTFPSNGYAFFDLVEAYEISPTVFHNLTRDGKYNKNTTKIFDLSLEDVSPAPDLTFDDLSNLKTIVGEGSAGSDVYVNSLQVGTNFSSDNNGFNIESNPVSSVGKIEHNILVISSYDRASSTDENSVYRTTAVGRELPELSIDRFGYYRLSMWVKSQDVSGGSGVTIKIVTDVELSVSNPDEYKTYSAENCGGDSSNSARYGWKEYAFYIQGSALSDQKIRLQLWLGQTDSNSRGIAMFDNIRFSRISAKQFGEYSSSSAGGTPVTFDNAYPDTGVTNGSFFVAGDYDKIEFPLPANGWTQYTANAVTTTGYSTSTSFIDNDHIISGLVPTDSDYYYQDINKKHSKIKTELVNPRPKSIGNIMLLSSEEKTAFNVTSESMTLSANTDQKVTVSMMVSKVDGYGASLVLKSGSKIISTIENITSTEGRFDTFTFYVQGSHLEKTLTLEIWLGLNDRIQNASKLSSGNIFVERVSYESMTEDFASLSKKLESEISEVVTLNRTLKYGVYSFKTENFTAYDYFDKLNFVKHPYNWSYMADNNATSDGVHFGIFDSTNFSYNQSSIPHSFKNKDAVNNNVLYMQNTVPTASRLSLDNQFQLLAETGFYRVDVSLKVNIPEKNDDNNVKIYLSGTDFVSKDIYDTSTTVDRITDTESFQTFSFYVMVGSEDIEIGITIGIGNGDLEKNYCKGSVFVNNISVVDITSPQYEEAVNNLKADEQYVVIADLSSPADTSTDTESSVTDGADDLPTPDSLNSLLVLPSILFGIALLIAIAGVVARRIYARILEKPRTIKSVSEYDRKTTLNKGFEQAVDTSSDQSIGLAKEAKQYEEFDDSLTPSTGSAKSDKPVEKQKPERVEVTSDTDSTSADEATSETSAEATDETAQSESVEHSEPEAIAKAEDKKSEEIKKANVFMDGFDD